MPPLNAPAAPVLLLSSLVAADAVGGGATQARLRANGIACDLIPTVVFGRHPGRGAPGGGPVADAVFEGALEGYLAQRPRPRAIACGYFASPAQVEAAARAIDRARAASPDLLVLVDPILGDAGRLYVPEPVARAVRDALVSRADVLTPNLFELGWLSGAAAVTPEAAAEQARRLAPIVFVTGLSEYDDRIGALAVTRNDVRYQDAERLPDAPNGTGDLFAAEILSRLLDGASVRDALRHAEHAASGAVRAAAMLGRDGLQADFASSGPFPPPVPRRLGAGRPAHVVGLDGAPGGWAGVVLDLNGIEPPRGPELFASFKAVLEDPRAFRIIAVDMPIGFAQSAEAGGRACERMTRSYLGPRRSSVFASPLRPALAAQSYADALARNRAAGGPGLSRQAWNLFPKMREIDALMTPALEGCVFETHPELVFAQLAGRPMAHAKRTPQGRSERLAVLAAYGLSPEFFEPHPFRRADAAPDDLVDAAALALSAVRIAEGEAVCLPEDPPRDEKGLRMAIFA